MPEGVRVPVRNAIATTLAVMSIALIGTPATAPAQTSLNCNLLAHVDSLPGSNASCWGYVDPNTGKEYAILGNQNGTAIYNIETPSAPVLTGFIPGLSSSWRELKTYSTYCYVGTEATGGGLQIIDLSNPEAPFLSTTYAGSGLSTIHSVTVDSVQARIYLNGSNGGCRILSLANPTAPVQVGNYTGAYVHDSHIRNDTLYASCITVGQERILNVANPAAITQVVAFNSELSSTHNGWTTEDRRYLLVTDETSGGRVTSWDIQTITSPVQVDGFSADLAGDAHNVHVRGNFAYVAHYTSGLQVLDITDPTDLNRVGYYDTYPSPGGLFNGCWGLYCWFPSGTIVLSDIEGGMFLVDFIENPGFAKGVVTDVNSALPITNAHVKVVETGAFDSTDVSGSYFLSHEAGSLTLEATAFGYVTGGSPVTIVAGDTATVDIALTPVPSGSISGAFAYGLGAGIPASAVRLRTTPLSTSTDGSGAYSFPSVPVGTYTVTNDFWTCIPESAQATVASGKTFANAQVDFTFEGVSFAFNMEDTSSTGWVVNVGATDNATSGIWTRVNPRGTGAQPEDDHTPDPLFKCWVTGQGTSGGSIGEQDVDNGRTTLYSPILDLTSVASPTIQYFRWFSNDLGSTAGDDAWKVQISSDGGTTWVTTDSTRIDSESWKEFKIQVQDFVTASNQVRMRFIAEDIGGGSIVEAGIDDFRLWGTSVVAIPGTPGTDGVGGRFALYPNSPNPFNPKTEIRFDLKSTGTANLAIYSLEGRVVKTLASGRLSAGPHAIGWDGRDDSGREVASGVYLMTLQAGGDESTRKISLVK